MEFRGALRRDDDILLNGNPLGGALRISTDIIIKLNKINLYLVL